MKPDNLIVDPRTGDTEQAEDVINELREVLKKHQCILMLSSAIGQPNEIVLAKVTEISGTVLPGMQPDISKMKGRAIAGIRNITPISTEWRRIDWTPPAATRTQ